MDVLKSAAALSHPPQSIMMTAYGSVDAAVEAMKQGAYDFVTKPLNLDAVEMVLKRALHTRNLETANQELTSRIQADSGLQKLLGRSTAMEHVFSMIRQVAPSKTTVLIEGERNREGSSWPRPSIPSLKAGKQIRGRQLRGSLPSFWKANSSAMKRLLHRRRPTAHRTL